MDGSFTLWTHLNTLNMWQLEQWRKYNQRFASDTLLGLILVGAPVQRTSITKQAATFLTKWGWHPTSVEAAQAASSICILNGRNVEVLLQPAWDFHLSAFPCETRCEWFWSWQQKSNIHRSFLDVITLTVAFSLAELHSYIYIYIVYGL